MGNKDIKYAGNELKYLIKVLDNTDVKADPFSKKLEVALKQKYKMKYAILVNSGTSALHTCLSVLQLQSHDEVINPALTVLMDSMAILKAGATPVFADSNKESHNIDSKTIQKVITKNTKVILPVGLHGLPVDIDPIREIANDHNLLILEDNAQCWLGEYKGVLAGTKADMTILSFETTKHVSCGEGGVILTNNEDLALKARKFAGIGYKNLGADGANMASTPREFQRPEYKRHDMIGLNYRMNEFTAAVAYAQFERVDQKVNLRRQIAKLYSEVFEADSRFIPQANYEYMTNSYYSYAVVISDAVNWVKLYEKNVKNGGDDFYAANALQYTEPALVNLGYFKKYHGKCPVAEYLQPRIIQFKTNYRTVEEAERNISILQKTLKEI